MVVALAATLFLLSITPPTPVVRGRDDGFSIYDVYWESWAGIGMNNTLAVLLSYTGELEAESLEASLDLEPILLYEASAKDSYNGTIADGQQVALFFNFKLPSWARTSHHRLPLKLDYEVNGERRGQSLEVPVSTFGAPDLDVETLDYEVKAGGEGQITIRVSNVGGGVARWVKLVLVPQSPYVVLLGENTYTRRVLEPGDRWNITVPLSVSAGNSFSLSVSAVYLDQHKNKYTASYVLGFKVVGEAVLQVSGVSATPTPMLPGDRAVYLHVAIANTGDAAAEDVQLTLREVPGVLEATYAGSNSVLLPYIPPGSVVDAVFLVDVDEGAEAGEYQIPLTAEYEGGSENLTVSITIREKARFVLKSLSFDPEPRPGLRRVKVEVELRNVANEAAENVRVSIVSPYLTGSTASLVGDVDADSPAILIVLEVDVDDGAPTGEVPIDIRVSWSQDGRSLSQTIGRTMRIREARSLNWPAVVMAGAGAAGIAVSVLLLLKKGD